MDTRGDRAEGSGGRLDTPTPPPDARGTGEEGRPVPVSPSVGALSRNSFTVMPRARASRLTEVGDRGLEMVPLRLDSQALPRYGDPTPLPLELALVPPPASCRVRVCGSDLLR